MEAWTYVSDPSDSRENDPRQTKVKTAFRLDLRICVTSGFGRGVNEIFALVGINAVLIGSYVPTK